MIEIPEIKVQLPARPPKYMIQKCESVIGIGWRVHNSLKSDISYFYGPNAKQHATAHADRLNAEASGVKPGTQVRDLPPNTLFRVASQPNILQRVLCKSCAALNQEGAGMGRGLVNECTPVTEILGRLVFTE